MNNNLTALIIEKTLVWHDEQDVSWDYGGNFKIYRCGTNYPPYRSPKRNECRLWRIKTPFCQEYHKNYIGTFKSIDKTKTIAEAINTSEKQ